MKIFPLRFFFVFMVIILYWDQVAQAQTDQETLELIQQRLNKLEEHLGLPHSEQEGSLDAVLQRLEKLERAVYGPDEGAEEPGGTQERQSADDVAPLPTGGEAEEWQSWDEADGDAETMMEADASGGFLNQYGSPYGLEINGYGILTYVYDHERDISTFRADGVELDLTKRLTDWAILGVDLDFINEGLDPVFPPFRHPGYAGGAPGGVYGQSSNGGDDDDDFVLEQLFMRARIADQVEVTGGKFNVPVGLEKRDPHERYAIYPSLLFELWPRDLTGIMATYQVTEQLSLNPYIFNGWDLDENNNESFIYALYSNYQIFEDLNIASTIAYGAPLPDNNKDDALLFDIELRYTGIPNAWFGLEYMHVNADVDHVRALRRLGDVTYQGFLGIAHYDFTDMIGVSLQSSLVIDEDGFVYGREQDRWEVSVIPRLRLTDSVEMRLQYQHVESDEWITFNQKEPGSTSRSKTNDQLILSAILSF